MVRTLRSCAFVVDDSASELHALAAFRLPTETAIGLTRGGRAGARRFSNLTLADGIADANDQWSLPPDVVMASDIENGSQGLLRVVRI